MQRDELRALRPSLIWSFLCGVLPSYNRKKHSSYFYKIYTIVLLVLPASSFFLNDKFTTLNKISLFCFKISTVTAYVRHCLLLVRPIFNQRKLLEFFNLMDINNQSLSRLNINQSHGPSERLQYFWMILTLAPLVLEVIPDSLAEDSVGLLRHLASLPLLMTSAGFFLKMRVLMLLLASKLELLNWHLDDLNNRWPLFLPKPPDVSFSEISCVASWRRTKFIHYDHHVRQITPEKIRAFNRAHFEIFHAFSVLNEISSLDWFLLVFTMAFNFVVLFLLLFSGIYHSNALRMFLYLLHVVTRIIPFGLMMNYASSIKKKSHNTALLVHDLLDEEGHSSEVIDELEHFSKALLHRKVAFTAAGFFPFSLKLVSRMASILAPIVLFLIQNQRRPRTTRTPSV